MKKELSFAAELPYIENEFEDAVWDTDTGLSTGDLEQLPAFCQGHFTVQDAAARLVALIAAPESTLGASNPAEPPAPTASALETRWVKISRNCIQVRRR